LLGLSFYLVFIDVFLRNIRREILRTKYSFRSIVLAASAVPFLSQFLGFSAKNYVMAGILFGIIINAALAQTSYQYALDENTISEG
jgi:hypothetical protein